MMSITVVSGLQNDAKSIGSIGKNINDASVKDGDEFVSGSFTTLENKYRTSRLVVAVAEPVPLLESEPSVGKMVKWLSEVVLWELRGCLSFGQRRLLFGLEFDCDGMCWTECTSAACKYEESGDTECGDFYRPRTGELQGVLRAVRHLYGTKPGIN